MVGGDTVDVQVLPSPDASWKVRVITYFSLYSFNVQCQGFAIHKRLSADEGKSYTSLDTIDFVSYLAYSAYSVFQ